MKISKSKESYQGDTPLMSQIRSLQRSVDSLMVQNIKTLKKIQHMEPQFQYQLYESKSIPGKQVAFQKQLLMKQVDRLLEEKILLDRKVQFYSIKVEEHKDKYSLREASQYNFLRTVWSKFHNSGASDSVQKIQQLNKAVCTLKNHICNITKLQKTQPSIPQFHPFITQTAYTSLRQKYQHVSMERQQLYSRMIEKDQCIERLRLENEERKKEVERLKKEVRVGENMMIKCRMEIMDMQESVFRYEYRVRQLEGIMNRSQRQMDSELTNSENRSNSNRTEEDNLSVRKGQVTFVNQADGLKIEVIADELIGKGVYTEIETSKSLLEIIKFFQQKSVKDQTQATQESVKIPRLLISDQYSCLMQDISERNNINKYVTQRQHSNFTSCLVTRSQRKLLSGRNEIHTIEVGKQKKFSRTGTNASISNNGLIQY